ncbi:MAG: Membrane protein insertase, YidC/Oxa1 family [Candidatus Amesbacteria bacterium GW2011_GWA2_42_12]|uniref:Membrane protein insertase, YidC/Oxa1 family n=1 Tax=Candidatus Amesbacteria bacterium GW2011_GWA2_42_12 TaxID=1618356 RepID=A0A0G1B6R9_9BACT|nr:MAG: Membrane protein insertase, YidC/Oxa1 family [Candidatus Amesbacteria bacterium GW2011_GWA2_42_12]
MINIWNLLLSHPLLNALIALTKLTGSFGWSIIILTIGLRVAMTPLVMPSLKASKKMQELSPELAALKEKFKTDKQGLVTAQAALYKEHGLNPASGCLPQIVQILVLIALFNAFNSVLKPNGDGIVKHLNPILYSNNKLPDDFVLSTKLYSLDLTKPDVYKIPGLPIPLPGVLLLLSAATQFLSSKMMMPEVKAEKKLAKKTEEKSDDIMAASQEQMLYMFPIMTIVFGFQFPAGLVIYWFVFSLVSMVQQYLATGWGGLTPWLKKFNLLK